MGRHDDWQYFELTKETLPVSGDGWIEGQEYVEGKDFERQWQTRRVGSSDWDLKLKEPNEAEKERCETRQAAVLINPNNSTVEITEEKSIMAIVKDRVAQRHGYDDYFQIDMIDASLEEKQEIKDSLTNEIAYEYAHFNQGEPIKEREQESYHSRYADGERCSMCKNKADRKVAEEILDDHPQYNEPVHELTAYVCNTCFDKIFRPYLTK